VTGLYEHELEVAERAARAAGEVIAAHYAKGAIEVIAKADASPVTAADKEASAVILQILRAAFPSDAILDEEQPDDAARLSAERVWIVDPLDGTRDFVARTGQFSVHVALAVAGEAVVGVMYQPVAQALYAARTGGGAWRNGKRIKVAGTRELCELRIGTSRQIANARLARLLAESGLDGHIVPMGASTRHAAIAAGELDATIIMSGDFEWDTAAPEVVIREAGGMVTDGDGRPFRYNQRDPEHRRGSIASNGPCHDRLVELVRSYL
jgi:3'(2'),5'-bisphosphate nucleotidase